MSQWIWKFGEFECYHNMLLHNRRTEYGYPEPPVWKIYSPDSLVQFKKTFYTDGGTVNIHALGVHSVVLEGKTFLDNKKLQGVTSFELERGTHTLVIRISNTETFPALYVSGVVESDGSWEADDFTGTWEKVGTWDALTDSSKTPDHFPFVYEPISPEKISRQEEGILYDFGKETFARVKVRKESQESAQIRFGESLPEAMDPEWCVVRYEMGKDSQQMNCPATAFRYVWLSDPDAVITAEKESVPLTRQGTFRTSDERLNQIYDVAAYTFELNSREFFLDGIKRDRWVWSGDVYQSLFVTHSLYRDSDIERRTLTSLGRKSPIKTHINGIVDYSFLWVMGIREYYLEYGDTEYLKQIFPRLAELIHFCRGRIDADGLLRGKEGDWIFIDWAEMDKTGALLGEQVLYAKALQVYAAICELLGKDDEGARKEAEMLVSKIMDLFWDYERGVFIDSYESGWNIVTRHNNILAYLFLPLSETQKESIYQNVICNENVPAITTPYFRFFENQVHMLAGHIENMVASIREYYGAMLDFGATTFFERFDEEQSGDEHYAMYGHPYEMSLCHAWSASPVYLLPSCTLGIRRLDTAWRSFEIRPELGDLEYAEGSVPVPGGCIRVRVDRNGVTVNSDISGGTLFYEGRPWVIEAGKTLTVTSPG